LLGPVRENGDVNPPTFFLKRYYNASTVGEDSVEENGGEM